MKVSELALLVEFISVKEGLKSDHTRTQFLILKEEFLLGAFFNKKDN